LINFKWFRTISDQGRLSPSGKTEAIQLEIKVKCISFISYVIIMPPLLKRMLTQILDCGFEW